MRIRSISTRRFAGAALALLTVVASAAFAGPPLTCHTIDISSAKSLPWISHDWNLTGTESYDTSKLASDTVAILATDSTVLVHMETLRRAAMYARKDPSAAKELLTRLTAATKSATAGAPPVLNYFDLGYLAETYKQWLPSTQNPAIGTDGYALIEQAIKLRGNDPEMEFAAALVTLTSHTAERQGHAQRAMAGAKTDPLLARNLANHFRGEQGQTIAQMLTEAPADSGRQR
jgi:hypothetical protein